MIAVKRIYAAADEEDGVRILVDRLWPRGITKDRAKVDEWMRDIAPSDELRKWYAHDPAKWPEFKRRYRSELADKERLVETLRHRAHSGRLTLLYSSKEEEYNNAIALRDFILEGADER